VPRLAAAAFAEEIDRRAKIAELDAYLAALDAGGIRALTAQRARLIELRRRGLRPATGQAAAISATDALVAAYASTPRDPHQ
jgi:hypothetical protein